MLMQKGLISFDRLLLTAITLVFFIAIASGQDKKSNALDKVKGKVQKITIQTDEGTVTYTGGEAQDLFNRLKSSPEISRIKIFKSDSDSEPEIFMFSPDKMDKHFKFFGENMKDGNKVKIKVENKDGEKIVTVTTIDKDGKEKIETYKGKEADDYLKKHEAKGIKKFGWFDKNGKGGNIFLLRKSDKDSTDEDIDYEIWDMDDSTNGLWYKFDDLGKWMKKKVKVTEENGIKKVTITTTEKDGKEKTETLTGKDAEEYLRKHDIKTKIKVVGDDGGVVKEIIIRKEKKGDKK